MSIPVVNLSGSAVERDAVLQLIHDAFTTVGFVFVTGHTIPREVVYATCESSIL